MTDKTKAERVRELAKLLEVGRGLHGQEEDEIASALRVYADSLERIAGEPEAVQWKYCPECGSEEVRHEEGAHKQCAKCRQEWFSDIDYSDVVRQHLAARAAPPPPDVQLDAERYRYMRTMNVPQFQHLFTRNVNGEGRFDDLVDAARAAEKK